jgi:glycerol kinase
MAAVRPLAHDARGVARAMDQQTQPLILALDCGTTSVRAIVFAGDEVLASAQREFTQFFPAPGLVEHDAEEIWTALLACMKDAVASAELRAQDVSAIGITNQRETIVVWDRATGQPIHRAIVWQDRRTAPVMDALRAAGHEERVREATGLTLDPYFSASKLAWILDAVDGARARAERGELAAGTIDSWVLWNLTKGRTHATDASNASRTMLARIGGPNGAAWDDALCELFHVPRAVLPEIVDSAGELGVVDASILDASILDASILDASILEASNRTAAIPVTGIAGDQQSALFGQGAHAMGDAKCTFGTGCFLLANAGETKPAPPKGLLATVAWRIAGRTMYAVEGSVFVGGSAVQWLRDGLQFFERAVEVNALAASVSDSGGVVVVPAFAGLGAPHWDASARGAILGLTRGATRAHIARATLEGVAHEVVDLIDAIRAGGVELHALRVDGGAAASDFLMQSCADFSQLAMERPKTLETTALGAARLARVGLAQTALAHAPTPGQRGENLSAVSTIPGGLDRRFEPVLGAAELARARARWNRAVDTVRFFGSPA